MITKSQRTDDFMLKLFTFYISDVFHADDNILKLNWFVNFAYQSKPTLMNSFAKDPIQ